MGETKTVTISIDDFQYYMRRDDRMSLIEKELKEAIDNNIFLEPEKLMKYFEQEDG